MLCCAFVVLTANQVSLGKKVTLVSSSEVVVQLLLWQWPPPPSTGLETHFIFLCLLSCDVCLFSPFSAGSLSEVLLGKLQHVVLAVMQRSLIQISVSEPVQRNPLTIQKADSNQPGAISFYHFSRRQTQKKKKKLKEAPLWFDQFRAQPWWTPRRRPRPRTLRTDPLLPAALLFGPTAATRSPGPRLGGRSRPERSRSG